MALLGGSLLAMLHDANSIPKHHSSPVAADVQQSLHQHPVLHWPDQVQTCHRGRLCHVVM